MQKNCDLDYTLKSRKSVFGQLFSSLFSTLIFFGFYVFFQFFFMYFITSKIIFSKFGMYLTYKNRFWGHFSWFLGRDINSTVWTRIGSKIKKRVMVFKGLKHPQESTKQFEINTFFSPWIQSWSVQIKIIFYLFLAALASV